MGKFRTWIVCKILVSVFLNSIVVVFFIGETVVAFFVFQD